MDYLNDYLMHYGIKGMKWGVRRYQKYDGSLTDKGKKKLQKDLKKDFKRNYSSAQPHKTSDSYKKKLGDEIRKVLTDDDKKRITDAKNKWLSSLTEADKAEEELYNLATKYGKEYYNDEMKRNSQYYDTPRMRKKLIEYAIYEYGQEKAREERPDLEKATHSGDKYWDDYTNECKKVTDKILGTYGDMKLYNDKYSSLSIRDTVGNVVSSMESQRWK